MRVPITWERTNLVVRTVFKIAEAVARRLVGSIPTRSRQVKTLAYLCVFWRRASLHRLLHLFFEKFTLAIAHSLTTPAAFSTDHEHSTWRPSDAKDTVQ